MKPNDTEADVVKKIVSALGEQPDISLECSGAEQSIRTAIQVNPSSLLEHVNLKTNALGYIFGRYCCNGWSWKARDDGAFGVSLAKGGEHYWIVPICQ